MRDRLRTGISFLTIVATFLLAPPSGVEEQPVFPLATQLMPPAWAAPAACICLSKKAGTYCGWRKDTGAIGSEFTLKGDCHPEAIYQCSGKVGGNASKKSICANSCISADGKDSDTVAKTVDPKSIGGDKCQ